MNAPGNLSAVDATQADQLTFGYRSDVGRRREHNEDSCAALGRADLSGRLDGLFVVADGMGGMGGGDVASSLVVQSLTQTVQEALRQRPTGRLDAGGMLLDALDRANAEVQACRIARPELRRMGTTCVAALVDGNRLTLANVGDSRVYLLRAGRMAQLTEDHSVVWEEMRAGRLTREQAQHSQFRNQILRGVGLAPTVEADLFTQTLRAGDTVLLCSDGLTVESEEAEIARILAATPNPQVASDRLVEAALRQGGSDNITVIVLRYGPFTPLAATEDEPTDPDAEWRKAAPQRTTVEPDRVTVGAPTSRNGMLRPLLVLLTFAVLAEAVGLGWLWQQAHRPAPAPVAPKPAPKPTRPTDGPLLYSGPELVWKGPLRDDILQITPEGNILVATQTGSLIQVTPQKTLAPPLLNYDLHVSTPATALRAGKGKAAPAHGGLDVTLDASGNRYELLPGRGIDKYDPAGAQVLAGIGKKGLQAATKLGVDASGNLYVIDQHQLKRFDAHPKPANGTP